MWGCSYQRILIAIKSESKSGEPNDPQPKALSVRCTVEEPQQILEAAERERRTISGFVLNTVCLEGHSSAKDRSQHAPISRDVVTAIDLVYAKS
jgi:hypothetical protein